MFDVCFDCFIMGRRGNKDSDNWEIILDEEERPQNFKLKQTVFELYLFLLSWLAPKMSKVEDVPDYCQLLEIKGKLFKYSF